MGGKIYDKALTSLQCNFPQCILIIGIYQGVLSMQHAGGYVKFTPKRITVGGEGGVSEFCQGCNLNLLVTEEEKEERE